MKEKKFRKCSEEPKRSQSHQAQNQDKIINATATKSRKKSKVLLMKIS